MTVLMRMIVMGHGPWLLLVNLSMDASHTQTDSDKLTNT